MIKVYGPYRRKDGRTHVIHYDTQTKKRRTQSYPRYLMEEYLGRELLPEEQVDHINDDPTDDRIENFQLLTHTENNRKSAHTETVLKGCPVCGRVFEMPMRTFRANQLVQKKQGPYCSKQCAGKVHH